MFSFFTRKTAAHADAQGMRLKDEADALLQRGEYTAAVHAYRLALEQAPKQARIHVNLAFALKESGDNTAAAASARQALALDPALADAHFLLAVLTQAEGRDDEAERHCRAALRIAPDFEAALLALCRLLVGQRRFEEASQSARAGLIHLPHSADLHLYLGNIDFELGHLESAIASFRNALALQPDNPSLLHNLASALFEQGNALLARQRYDDAAAIYQSVLQNQERHFGALFQLGYLRQQQGRHDEAMGHLQRALDIEPHDAGAAINLGVCLRKARRYDEALARLQVVFDGGQRQAEAADEIGIVHQELGQFADAASWHERAAQLAPTRPQAHNNLGLARQLQYRLDDAEAAFGRAIEADPHFADAHANLGMLHSWSMRSGEALASFDRALTLDPEHALARDKRALVHLLLGNYEAGWPDHEARWLAYDDRRIVSAKPHWRGDAALAGKTIVLYTEQGYGDSLQFVRYASLVAQLGATVWLLAPPTLQTLFAGVPGVARVFSSTSDLPDYDYLCPLMSLPLAFGTTLATIPAEVPYLRPAPERVAAWRDALGARAAPHTARVGLVWSGNPHTQLPRVAVLDRKRSLHFDQIRPLLSVPGLEFHSLQLGAEALAQRQASRLIDHAPALHDFHDTAALIANLDLVISVDTSVAHLAGALGKRVWLMNRRNTDWRWLTGRSDSPWYPTMRIFRQSTSGDWDSVIDEVADALAAFDLH